MTEKWIVDDAGTLINMETRENYDYMEEVVDVLNKLSEETEQLKLRNKQYSMMVNANSDLNDEIYEQLQKTEKALKRVCEENKQLRKELGSFEQVSFTDLCDKTRTILYMKKENGDSE